MSLEISGFRLQPLLSADPELSSPLNGSPDAEPLLSATFEFFTPLLGEASILNPPT